MTSPEQIIEITTLYIYRGQGLEALLEKYGDTEDVKLVGATIKSHSTSGHAIYTNIGPIKVKDQRGLVITSQRLYEDDIANIIKFYDDYQHQSAVKGDGDLFYRIISEKLYLLDKHTNTVAEFALVPKKDRIYTADYRKRGIQALNPALQISLELTPNLYILTDKNKLRKWRMIKQTDFTRPTLESILPGVCRATFLRTCLRERTAIMIDTEISCTFDGDIKEPLT